jgi:RNA-directed DNA polymerase
MKDTPEYTKYRQLQIEDLLREDRLETEGSAGVYNSPTMSEKESDGTKVEAGKDLLEKILSADNMNAAYKKVKGNKGSPGIDGMTVEELLPYLKAHGEELKESILMGKYKPQPVRRVEIPKPEGGVRLLGLIGVNCM